MVVFAEESGEYAAAPSAEEGGGAGRYSGYGMGEMGGGGYAGGYTDERPLSNEGGIPMKYYVRLILPPSLPLSIPPHHCVHAHVPISALPTRLPQDPSDPSTYPATTTPVSSGPSGPSIHTTNNTINTTSNAGSGVPFSQNPSAYGG